MLVRFPVVMAIAVAGGVGSPLHASDTSPYEFKGVTLGITLTEFQAIPAPDDYYAAASAKINAQFKVKAHASKPEPSCTTRGEILVCQWVINDTKYGGSEQEVTPISNGNGRADFEFASAPGDQKRLARIVVRSNETWWDDFEGAYTVKYGQPKKAQSQVQNGYGADFDQTTLTWSNGVSDIVMVSRCDKIDQLCITYSDKALTSALSQVQRKGAVEGASNL